MNSCFFLDQSTCPINFLEQHSKEQGSGDFSDFKLANNHIRIDFSAQRVHFRTQDMLENMPVSFGAAWGVEY